MYNLWENVLNEKSVERAQKWFERIMHFLSIFAIGLNMLKMD
jgi:hypothetical protein